MIRRSTSILFLLFSLIFLSITHLALGQKKKDKEKKKKEKQTEEPAPLPTEVKFDIYDFKNMNRITDYYDKGKMQKLRELEEKKDWEKLYGSLHDYVKNFAVENFYKDTYWIWRLAKLTELYGDMEEARMLYKLVLRHHHEGINLQEIEIYYDTLNIQETQRYVPLDYYYELVEYRKSIDTLRPPRGVLLNIGPTVNSRDADYGPSLSADNTKLIFTARREETQRGLQTIKNEDLYSSAFDGRLWSLSEPLDNVNTIYNEGSACQSRDGQRLYFSRCESPDGFGSCDLYMASLDADSTWREVVNLGPNINSVGWDSQPSLSLNEDTIFFASDRIGGFGLSDIYYSVKDKSGDWTPARNLGPVVNTRGNDVSPFFHPEFKVLYFSSNGQLYNFGEFDIYKAYSENGNWTEPLNIGPLVNGRGSEYYFTIDSKANRLFYARSVSEDLTKLDIYSFPLPMEAQPLAVTPVTGSLTDGNSGDPFGGIVSIIDLEQGVEVAPQFLNEQGRFEFDLINQRNYLLVIQGDDFFRIEEMFFLDGPREFNFTTEAISSRIQFESIEFANGMSDLQSQMYGDLNKIVNFMYDNPDFKIKISGHTDSDGPAELNLKLSQERAQNIRDYIVIFGGIEPERVGHQGFGSSQPLVEGTSEEAKAINRRVEFEISRPQVQND